MKKIILSIALFVGFVMVSSAQTNASGDVPPAKLKPVTETSKPDGSTSGTSTATPTAVVITPPTNNGTTATTTATTKKSNKKSCCKTKSDGCCKKKTEAIKED